MEPKLQNCIIVCSLLLGIWMHGQHGDWSPTIVLDPGHGGTDSGALATDKGLEKNLTLKVALEALRLNGQILEEPLNIYLTRYSDTLISLKDRGRLSKGLAADIFVSIHGNHAPNPKVQGIEVFVWRPFPKYGHHFARASIALAGCLADELHQNVGLKSRGIKKANFQVLRDNRGQYPSILVELGFLSNWEEATYLKSQQGIQAVALAILLGISKYIADVGND